MGAELKMKQLLEVLWRRRLVIAGVTLLLVIGVYVLVKQLPLAYTAQGMLQMEASPFAFTEPQGALGGPTVDLANVRSATAVLRSWSLLAEVAKKLKLQDNPEFNPLLPDPDANWLTEIRPREWIRAAIDSLPFMPQKPPQPVTQAQIDSWIIGTLWQNLTTDTDGKSYVIYLTYSARDPDVSAAVVNAVMETYVARERAAKSGSVSDTNEFFNKRVENLRLQLEEADRKVQSYLVDHNLLETKQGTVSAQQLADLNTQLSLARAERTKAQARYQQAVTISKGRVTADQAAEVLESPLIQSLTQREAELQQVASNARARLGAKHPERVAAEADLANLRGKIATETAKIVAALGSQAAVAVTGEQTLEAKIGELQKSATTVAQADVQLQQLQKDADTKRLIYTSFLTKMENTAQPQASLYTEGRIVSPAVPPTDPSAPRTMIFVAFGAVASLMAVCAGVLSREQLRRGFVSLPEIAVTTGLPGFAAIAEVRRRGSPVDFIVNNPTSELAETIRGIRARLKLSGGDQPVKVVLVTSAMPQEGKTSFAASFARLSARDGQNVLLVEGDLRRPKIGALFRGDQWRPWQDALTSSESIDRFIGTDPQSGLHFLAAREERESRLDLFEAPMFRHLIRSAGRLYDFVIIDSPPVLHVSDSLVLAQHADAILLMVRANRTPRAVVAEAIARLSITGKPIGVIGSRMASSLPANGIYVGYARGAA